MRVGLLLSEVGGRNNISASPEEMNRAMMEEVRRYPGQEQQMLELYNSIPGLSDSLRAPIIEDKVVDFIVELAQVESRSVSIEELLKPDDEGEKGKSKPAGKKKPAKKATAAKKPAKAKKAKGEKPAEAATDEGAGTKEG